MPLGCIHTCTLGVFTQKEKLFFLCSMITYKVNARTNTNSNMILHHWCCHQAQMNSYTRVQNAKLAKSQMLVEFPFGKKNSENHQQHWRENVSTKTVIQWKIMLTVATVFWCHLLPIYTTLYGKEHGRWQWALLITPFCVSSSPLFCILLPEA